MESVAIGNIVRLKSGGPEMTVTMIYSDIKSCCAAWFDVNQNYQCVVFKNKTLELERE